MRLYRRPASVRYAELLSVMPSFFRVMPDFFRVMPSFCPPYPASVRHAGLDPASHALPVEIAAQARNDRSPHGMEPTIVRYKTWDGWGGKRGLRITG